MELEEAIEDINEAKLILLCNNVIELIVVITEGRKQGLFKNKFWDLENDEELDLNKLKNIAIEPILKELDKQEKMIELMSFGLLVPSIGHPSCGYREKGTYCELEAENKRAKKCHKCIIKYYEKKAEGK